jgi:hypothetical protein
MAARKAQSRTGRWRWTSTTGRKRTRRSRAAAVATATRVAVDDPVVRTVHGHRAPTLIEQRAQVDFAALENAHAAAVKTLVHEWQAVRARQITDLARQVADATGLPDLTRISATVQGSRMLAGVLGEVTVAAVRGAFAEAAGQGARVKEPAHAALEVEVNARASATASLLVQALSDSARRKAVALAGGALSNARVAPLVREHLTSLTDAFLVEQFTGAVTMAQNGGRRAVFHEAQRAGHGARYYISALLDSSTCSNCRHDDGRQYASLAEITAKMPTGGNRDCLGGIRCRCAPIAVYDEAAASVQ